MGKMTWEDMKKMAIRDESEEIHPNEAMRRLGLAFAKLRECKNGRDFMWRLKLIFEDMRDRRVDRGNVNIHTIIGICQLAHHIRDEVSPSRRKSFNREAIPILLKLRDKAIEKTPEDIVEFVLLKFEERNW